MARFFLALLLFGALIYWIFLGAKRDRIAIELRSSKPISWLILVFELILFGVIVTRVPIVRTRPGLILAGMSLLTLHAALIKAADALLRRHGWIHPARDEPPAITVHRKGKYLSDLISRHFYLTLAIGYLLAIGLILLIHRLIAR